tara:strand:+ start:10097 stop:12118 length:2022 start_codon:yes stop_codon:yes gene_type:complete
MKSLVIIQARLGSSRFKNKILKKINKLSLIEILYKRLVKSNNFNIIVAIPDNIKNDKLNNFLVKRDIPVFRGDENNVLSRYYYCAIREKAKTIIRVTADCPLIDASLINILLSKFHSMNIDYLSNTINPTYPDGFDIEIFKFKILNQAFKYAHTDFDKEHVTSFFYKIKSVKKHNFKFKSNLSKFRLTIDYEKDLDILKKIIKVLGNNHLISSTKILNHLIKNKLLGNEKLIRNLGSFDFRHQAIWDHAKQIIPGGNMLLSKNPDTILPNLWPTYFTKAKGCYIWDLEGRKLFDCFTMGVGTNILGYSNSFIDLKVKNAIDNGSISSLNSFEEVQLAEKLIELHPWSDMVKFARTGAEANSIAIRLARASTDRTNIAVCGYHGWHDWYLSANLNNKKNLDEHLIQGLAVSGVPKNLSGTVFPFKYNNINSLKLLIKNKNIGIIKMEVIRNQEPDKLFLQKVREIANKNKIILIFDECTTGFRETLGGIHLKYNVSPDLAVFGKALGNGYPITAVIGKESIMKNFNKTFISSTFWTERLGFVAALETIKVMEKKKSWIYITNLGNYVKRKWAIIAKSNNIKINIYGIPALLNFDIVSKDAEKYHTYLSSYMLNKKILASNVFYLSVSHNKKNLEKYFNCLNNFFIFVNKCEKKILDINQYLNTPVRSSKFQRLN